MKRSLASRFDPPRIRSWASPVQYAFAIGAVLLALAVRWWLQPMLGGSAPWITVLLAMLFLAIVVRSGPLLAGATLGFVGVHVLFLGPVGSAALDTRSSQLQSLLFLVGTAIAVFTSRQFQRAHAREACAEERFFRFFHSGTIGVAEADPLSRRLVSVNPAFCSITGYAEAELLAMTVDQLNHPDDREADRTLFEQLRSGAQRYEAQKRYVRKDGSVVWVLASGGIVRDAAGRPQRAFAAVQDVTARKHAEDALRESQERVQLALSGCEGGTWDVDLTTGRVVWSDNTATVLGFAPLADGVELEIPRDTVAIEDLPALSAAWRRAMLAREVLRSEFRIRRIEDGRTQWVRVAGRFFYGDAGRAVRFTGVWFDVTEEKEAAERLREAHERTAQALEVLRSTYEQSPVGLAQLDRELRFVRVNEKVAAMDGVPVAEHLGRTIHEIVPEVAPRVEASLRGVLETGEAVMDTEVAGETGADPGVLHTWLASWYPLRDGSGRVIGVNVVAQDISERKRAEQALRESEERFHTMADSTPAMIWTADAAGAITFCNRRWLEYTGLAPESVLAVNGPAVLEIVHAEDRARCVDGWGRALANGSEFEVEVRNRRGDGSYRWFLTRAVPIRDEHGRLASWYGSSTDIHETKLAEEALRDADRRKDEFLAMLAHELRNPLAPIKNSLAVLRLGTADAATTERVRAVMERQVTQMVRLVDDLMEVSRIRRGRIELKRERVALAAIVQSAVETSRPLVEAAGHQLGVLLPEEPVVLDADPVRLAQVLTNLLNNAAKYTDPGGQIWLSAWREGANLVLSVRDTGVGIPPEQLPSVFDLFSQADRSYGRAQGGLGIGLTLVRALVELHDGSVEARSDGPGKGSEFVVRLPLPNEAAMPVAERRSGEPARDVSHHRVLVVDDNRDAAESLAALISLRGADVGVAHDGVAALQALASERPGLVLLDIGMPGMDGYEVARRMRACPEGRDVTLVALTGWGQSEDRRRSHSAGFDAHLVKPVELEELDALLAATYTAAGGDVGAA